MKKSFFYFGLSLLTIVAGCQREEVETTESGNDVMEIYASVETVADLSTRTYLEGTEVLWNEGDQIAVCMGNATVSRFNVKSGSEGSTNAVFEKDETYKGEVSDVQLSNNIAWYPFCEFSCTSRDSGYMLLVDFPSAQKYAPDSFPEGAFPMVAVTKDVAQQEYSFRNVCGAIMLQLKGSGSIRSVSITGNSSEILAGIASVSAAYGTEPSVELLEDECTTVTLDCGEDGVALDADVPTSFIIALPPVPFEKGFVITVTDTRGGSKNYVTAKPNPIIRSKIRRMPVQEYDGIIRQAGDYIDEYGINHGQGIEIDGVVWAPVNCGYHATDFKVGKLYQWGRRYGQGAEDDVPGPKLVRGYGDGNDEENENVFFYGYSDWHYLGGSLTLWNSGSESEPVKAKWYDPCPNGWRVPTYAELEGLSRNHSERTYVRKYNGNGYWFSGKVDYAQSSAKVFLTSPGRRDYDDGHAYKRMYYGYYWSSRAADSYNAYYLGFDSGDPEIDLDRRGNGFSVRCVYDFNPIPLTSIDIAESVIKLYKGDTYQLHTYGKPDNANYNTAEKWISDNPQVAVVDDNGLVRAVSDGEAVIKVSAGDVFDQCEVVVTTYVQAVATADYIDEYGVNHGKGVSLGLAVWAPVNCGYKAPSDTDKGYPYGKLYQCGRRYGQGYSEEYDETVPSVQKIGMSMSEAQAEDYANVFFTDWQSYSMILWNTGDEENPVKTEYDPCPKGWRVPTYPELAELSRNSSTWTTDSAGMSGCWLSGIYPYATESPQVFFPAAGRRDFNPETVKDRGVKGYYWSSGTTYAGNYYGLTISQNSSSPEIQYRVAFGFSVRCVQE